MAVPKRGSRRIIINGITYRWYIRSKPSYGQGSAWSNLTAGVSLESGGGTLLIDFTEPRPDAWLDPSTHMVTPAQVSAAIRKALVQGWQPDSGGGTFVMTHEP